MKIEEMITKSHKGISCKICSEEGFGVLFRTARGTNKSKYGCHKCILDLLEKSFANDSDENKEIRDLISGLRV